jgi:hypothetical protein
MAEPHDLRNQADRDLTLRLLREQYGEAIPEYLLPVECPLPTACNLGPIQGDGFRACLDHEDGKSWFSSPFATCDQGD